LHYRNSERKEKEKKKEKPFLELAGGQRRSFDPDKTRRRPRIAPKREKEKKKKAAPLVGESSRREGLVRSVPEGSALEKERRKSYQVLHHPKEQKKRRPRRKRGNLHRRLRRELFVNPSNAWGRGLGAPRSKKEKEPRREKGRNVPLSYR